MLLKTNSSILLEEGLKEVNLKRIDTMIDKDFNKEALKLEITKYLKKITRLCNSYIDNKFLGNDEEKILKRLELFKNGVTCLYKNKINAVYDLIKTSHITTDEKREQFKIDLHNLISFGDPRKKTDEELDYEHRKMLLEINADLRIERMKTQREEYIEAKKEQREQREAEQKKEKENMENFLNELKSDKSCLTESSDISDLSEITKIYFKNKSKSSLLHSLKLPSDITTIILEDFDLIHIIALFKKLDLKKIITLVLIHKQPTFSDNSKILELLEEINNMTNLTYFEFSNFKIDLSVLKIRDNNTCVELFSSILEKKLLTFFYFDNNEFKDDNALKNFEDNRNNYWLSIKKNGLLSTMNLKIY
jgi:hypothetical protein